MKKGIISVLSILSVSIVSVSAQKLYEDDLYGSRRTEKISEAEKVKPVKKEKVRINESLQNPDAEFVETFDDALLKRLYAYGTDDSYPEEYWKIFDMYVNYLSNKYDEDLYNVIVVNGKAWVEPIYITSVFDGSDPTIGLDNYSKKLRDGLAANKKSSNVNVTINVIDPWDFAFRPYSPWGLSFSRWGGHSPFYWGGGYYNPYYWAGGYYPSWGGYYPPYWGGGYYPNWGYYPPYWGGGYYPPHWGGGHIHNSRPVYYGNTRYGGSPSGGNHNGDYRPGQGFIGGRNNSVSNNRVQEVNTRQNVRVYDASERFRGGSSGNLVNGGSTNRPTYTRPTNEPQRNQVIRNNDSFRRFEPTRNDNFDRISIPTQQQSRPSYNPPVRNNGGGFGGGGGNTGGGGGGGIRRSR